MRKISQQKRNDAIALLLDGLSTREIAKRLGIGHMTVDRIRRETSLELPMPRAGRPKILSAKESERIAHAVHLGRCKNAPDALKKYFHDTPTPPSLSTIRRALHAAGLKRYRRRKKPRLSKQHIRERLLFAKRYAGWTAEDWRCVVFSDEAKFSLYEPDGDAYYWGMPGEELQRRNIQEKVAYGGGHIMIWGCITAAGGGLCTRIEGNMNADLYVQILDLPGFPSVLGGIWRVGVRGRWGRCGDRGTSG